MKKEITTPSKRDQVKQYATSAVKVALALAFVIAAMRPCRLPATISSRQRSFGSHQRLNRHLDFD